MGEMKNETQPAERSRNRIRAWWLAPVLAVLAPIVIGSVGVWFGDPPGEVARDIFWLAKTEFRMFADHPFLTVASLVMCCAVLAAGMFRRSLKLMQLAVILLSVGWIVAAVVVMVHVLKSGGG